VNWDLRRLFKRASRSPDQAAIKPALDGKTRATLLKDTNHLTPVSGMRTMWGLLSSYWKNNEKYAPFEGFAVLNKRKLNPKVSPWIVAGVITALVIAEAALSVGSLHLIKNFWDAMVLKDMPGMFAQGGYMLGLLTLIKLAESTRAYLSNGLRLSWQGSLTHKFTQAYLNDKAFFHIHRNPKDVDNPDQRMSDDCEKFPSHVIGLVMGGLSAAILFPSAAYMMWSSVPLFAASVGFAGALIYAGLGTMLTKKIYEPLIFLNGNQLKKDANFRADLKDISNSASEIASYPVQDREKERLDGSFSELVKNYQSVMVSQFTASFIGGVYTGTRDILKVGAAANAFFTTSLTFGGAVQFAAVFDKLAETLSWAMTVIPAYNEAKVRAKRLTSLAQRIEDAQDLKVMYSENGVQADIETHQSEDGTVTFKNLRIDTPEGKTLVTIPHLVIRQGERVLMQGKSGSGKSTILRAIFNMCKHGKGDIFRPAEEDIFFASQSPLVTKGTLRENLIHPHSLKNEKGESLYSDAECHRALELAMLPDLIPLLDETGRSGKAWAELSAGEKQRLVFARLFLNKKYSTIVLDEATSALDPELQEKMYDHLVRHNPDAIILSIAHRSEIGRFHNRFLAVTKTGQLMESLTPTPDRPRQAQALAL
jgi:putative ATP-binding cassette transporter